MLPRQNSHRMAARFPRGFTIVEMLLVVGVIMLLLAIMLPSLSAVQRRAAKTVELNHLRQLGMAWNMYANQNRDFAIPGWISDDDNDERSVFTQWRVRYEYPFAPEFGAGPDGADPTIPREIAQPWTWRLAQYIDYNPEILFGYRRDAMNDVRTLVDNGDLVSVEPAFGYNSYYVGGWWRVASGPVSDGDPTDSTSFRPRPSLWDATKDGQRVNVVVTRLSTISQPDRLVVFSSSTEVSAGTHTFLQDDVAGSHLVTPPAIADQEQWEVPAIGSGGGGGGGLFSGGSGGDRNTVAALETTAHIPVGRYNRMPAILHADGSTDSETVNDLYDQRRWINGMAGAERHFRHQGSVWD